MADRLRDILAMNLRQQAKESRQPVPPISPVALMLCDILDQWKSQVELSAGDANITASKAYNSMNEVKADMHRLKTQGESA